MHRCANKRVKRFEQDERATIERLCFDALEGDRKTMEDEKLTNGALKDDGKR
jgi:hypothetical protein